MNGRDDAAGQKRDAGRPAQTGALSVPAVRTRVVRSTVMLPASLHVALIATCEGGGLRSRLDLEGALVLSGLGADLIFEREFRRFPGPADAPTRAILVPDGECLGFDPQRFTASAGDDAVAWIQVRDGHGNPLTGEYHLGRLGQGTCELDPGFTTLVEAEISICPFPCGPLAESGLTLTGELRFVTGISARIVLRRREGALWWRRPPDGTLDFAVVPQGQRIQFPAQSVRGVDSGDTLRSLLLLGEDGEPIGDEHLVEPGAVLH